MVEGSVTDSSIWAPNCHFTAVKLITRAIAELGSFVDDLIEGREDIVSELNLSNGRSTSASCSNGKASDTLLAQGSVEHAISAVLLVEAHSAAEHAAKLDILTENESAIISFHGHVERVHNS